MKMCFAITVEGEESVEKKFQELITTPGFDIGFISQFFKVIIQSLKLEQADNIAVIAFNATRIDPSPEQQLAAIQQNLPTEDTNGNSESSV